MTAVIGNAVINKMTYKSPFLKHNSCRDNGYAANPAKITTINDWVTEIKIPIANPRIFALSLNISM